MFILNQVVKLYNSHMIEILKKHANRHLIPQ